MIIVYLYTCAFIIFIFSTIINKSQKEIVFKPIQTASVKKYQVPKEAHSWNEFFLKKQYVELISYIKKKRKKFLFLRQKNNIFRSLQVSTQLFQ